MKDFELPLYQATDEILFYLWEPTGVKDTPAARDEYQSYLPKVCKLTVSDTKKHNISAYLNKIETTPVGLWPNEPHAMDTANLLLEAKEFYCGQAT